MILFGVSFAALFECYIASVRVREMSANQYQLLLCVGVKVQTYHEYFVDKPGRKILH